MYLYFNSKGVLEEVVNDIPTRKDSSNVNHIYVYIDGVAYDEDDKYYPLPDSIESLSTRYQLPDGTITPVALVQGKVQQSIPYDKHRDMKCFKDFYNYEFFDIELPSGVNEDGSQSEMPNVLGQSGLVALTIIEQPVGLALGLVVFTVEQEVGITTDTLITEAQFNYLMGYVAKYDKQVSDIKILIPDGTTENNKLTNTTIVQKMIDANIPTFTDSTIWTKDFITKVAKVGYAIYMPTNTMYSVFNADDSNIELQLSNASGLVLVSYDISVGQTILQATTSGHNLVETIDGRIPNVTSVIELHDAASKWFVLEQISNVETEIESLGQYAQNTQQELNELKASLYGYVFSEDTANFSKLDISALPSMINNNNVAYNTRLMLDTVKGRSVKWTQLVDASKYKDTQTISGVTFTFNKANGTITVNGTATEDISYGVYPDGAGLHVLCSPQDYVYLKGCPSGGSESTYYLIWANAGKIKDFGSGYYNKLSILTDTTDLYCNPEIKIKSGVTMTNKIFRPQLFNVSNIYGLGKEPKTMADFNKDYPYSIYPYGKQEILTTKVSGIRISAGYKNWIDKNDLLDTSIEKGVTFTVDKINGTITVNGTATEDIYHYIYNNAVPSRTQNTDNNIILLQGCPSGGSSNTYELYTALNKNYPYTDVNNIFDMGRGAISTTQGSYNNHYNILIFIKQGIVCNNLVFKPQLINLTNTYGAGNEPKTVAQFNQDFPDIDNIPYPEQTISFDEQTLYGINTAQDTLKIVKDNYQYSLVKEEHIGNADMGTLSVYKSVDTNHKYFNLAVSNIQHSSTYAVTNTLTQKYITDTEPRVYNNVYNLTIVSTSNGVMIYDKNAWETMTDGEFVNSLSGQMVYYQHKTPVTTTIATLTKNQVTALFAKGYCVEILGNDDNNIIVRPDLSLNMVVKLIGGNTNE